MTAASARCDAPEPRPLYVVDNGDGSVTYGCRCIVCARCEHHTGNATQGHHWAWCQVTKSLREPHFCCPGACEYETKKHVVDITDAPSRLDARRYRWECSCGAAGTAPGWVDNAPEFHVPAGDTITRRDSCPPPGGQQWKFE
jgi:hypothetical protein